MIVGFDYWNVISHYPDEMYELLSSLASNVNTIYVISAVGSKSKGTVLSGVRSVWPNLPPTFDKFVIEVEFKNSKESPALKLAKCKELGIQIFFDDRQDVCDLLNANGIFALKVPRKDARTDTAADRN